MKFSNIAEIQNHPWVGNAHSDGPAFLAADAFARDTANSMADRAEAIRTTSIRGMGLTMEDAPEMALPDDKLVQVFIDYVLE